MYTSRTLISTIALSSLAWGSPMAVSLLADGTGAGIDPSMTLVDEIASYDLGDFETTDVIPGNATSYLAKRTAIDYCYAQTAQTGEFYDKVPSTVTVLSRYTSSQLHCSRRASHRCSRSDRIHGQERLKQQRLQRPRWTARQRHLPGVRYRTKLRHHCSTRHDPRRVDCLPQSAGRSSLQRQMHQDGPQRHLDWLCLDRSSWHQLEFVLLRAWVRIRWLWIRRQQRHLSRWGKQSHGLFAVRGSNLVTSWTDV